MSNRQYDFNLAAALGATQRLDVTGSKIKVLTSPAGPVGIKVDGGPEVSLLEGQGFSMPPGKTFRDVLIRNLQAVANNGTIFIGDEGFEDSRITGSVIVLDRVSASIQTQAVGFTAVTGLTATAIVTPAANVNGMIVRGYSVEALSVAGGNAECCLIASPSAPVSTLGANLLTLARVVDSAQVRQFYSAWTVSRQLPAGWGLYHVAINVTNVASSNSARATFELL